MKQSILIVDDERDIRSLLGSVLQDEGFETREAANSDEALARVAESVPDLVILDIWLIDSALDGLEVLDEIHRRAPQVPVLIISGHGTVDTAVAAIKKGAYDFLEKPFKTNRLMLLVERALDAAKLRRENEELRTVAHKGIDLVGSSSAINAVRNISERVGPSSSRVLISGPKGAGKEVVARFIHSKSRNASAPFLPINCSALHPDSFEAILFGRENSEGMPVDIGIIEQAGVGTVLFDEIADMPLDIQQQIVRVVQEQTFCRVAGTTPIRTDVRIMATTSRDLEDEIEKGQVREDLYNRLNVVPIKVPPLSARRDDIPVLARHFMNEVSQENGVSPKEFAEDAIAAMQTYEWPGNVRQLLGVIEWLLVMTNGQRRERIRASMLPPEISNFIPTVMPRDKSNDIMGLPLREARERFEREYLTAQVSRFGGNISQTASFVGMERSALHRKLKSLGVGERMTRQ